MQIPFPSTLILPHISNDQIKKMYQQYLHKKKDDQRSQNEIFLSSKLTQKLTQLNLKRIELNERDKKNTEIDAYQISKSQQTESDGKKKLFICISGMPPFQGEFQNFKFPGKVIKYSIPGFQFGLSEQQRRQRALKCDLNFCSIEINEKINQFPSAYQLVFVCHSYGTYIASYFFKNFFEEKKDRIKGIIELGGGPIRIYKIFEDFVLATLPVDRKFFIENIDLIYERFKQGHKTNANKHFPISAYSSKYHILSAGLATKTQKFNELFELNRKMPKILKLFIYGQKDYIFDQGNGDEKSIYYLYKPEAQLDPRHQKQMSEKFTKLHNQPIKNIQQKFIYKLPQGKHSLHMQKELTPLIQKLIDDYLQVIF